MSLGSKICSLIAQTILFTNQFKMFPGSRQELENSLVLNLSFVKNLEELVRKLC